MHDVASAAEAIHPLQMRALIYLWADLAVTEVCRMDPKEQRRRCAAWAAARNWPVIEVLVDELESPSTGARPALQQLRAAMQDHACEVVVIPALISLGPQVEAVLALLDLLARHGVDLVSLHEAFDTTTAHGSFALLVVRALAGIAQHAAPTRPAARARSRGRIARSRMRAVAARTAGSRAVWVSPDRRRYRDRPRHRADRAADLPAARCGRDRV
jgi:DNA invertase Pin-like site-specific DNA recombinase